MVRMEDLWLEGAGRLGPIVDPASLDDDITLLKPVASAGWREEFYEGYDSVRLDLLCPVEGGEWWLAQYVEDSSSDEWGSSSVSYLLIDRSTYEEFYEGAQQGESGRWMVYDSQVWADPWPEEGDYCPEYDEEPCPVCGAHYSCPHGLYRAVQDARLYAVKVADGASVPEGYAFFSGEGEGWLLPKKVGEGEEALRLLILPPRKARRVEAHYGVEGLEVAEGRYAFFVSFAVRYLCEECGEVTSPGRCPSCNRKLLTMCHGCGGWFHPPHPPVNGQYYCYRCTTHGVANWVGENINSA